MRTKEFLRKVMSLAWRICKVTGATLSEALKRLGWSQNWA